MAPPLPPGTQRVSRSAMRSEEEETEGVRSDVSPESYLSTLDDLIDIQFTTEGPESSTEPPEQVEDGMEGKMDIEMHYSFHTCIHAPFSLFPFWFRILSF